MQQMTASHAKQNFGELLDALAHGPVAIERHKKVKAIVCSPEAFKAQIVGGVGGAGEAVQESMPPGGQLLAERRAARAAQLLVDKERLIKHQRVAIELLLMPEAKQRALIEQARAEVARWRRERLCSPDYADRWDELLARPVADLARAMASESLEWGVALRQNSPWHVVALEAQAAAQAEGRA